MSQQLQEQVLCPIDPYQYLQITRNPDGSITRLASFPTTVATPDADTPSRVLSKDLPLNPNNATFLRLYLPHKLISSSSSSKLPVIVYFHGGGFVLLSASSSINHDFCSEMATKLSAVIVSVEYRLAPEARLPAAYDDAVEALHWLKATDEKWIREFSDVSSCYLMGTSAGGNMAYHVGLNVAAAVDEFGPLKIKGLILHHPYFGGSQRTESEVRLANNPTLPLSANDLMWELALPPGADRDHEYCNPMEMHDLRTRLDEIGRLGWEVILPACDGDPVIDRQVELVNIMRSRGVKVVDHVGAGHHGMDLLELSKAGPLFNLVKDFVHPS
ncbi:probable carboxylesterase 120 [Neltuma alba]|uniref:probable carboxylesterase 120 n=1 Tax=Neltuma alba TaxID=207710 RepID=UPI0010A4326B|nr:probable carboxylesterase 120 [Prosopis alba]